MPVAVMPAPARRSSRRSIVVDAPLVAEKKSRRSLPAPVTKTTSVEKKSYKKVITEVDEPQTDVTTSKRSTRNCVVKVIKLQQSKGDFKSTDVVTPAKLSKQEKALMLPKKSTANKIKKPAQPTKVVKNKKKSGKFQLKIRKSENKTGDDEESDLELENEVGERKRITSGGSEDRPDSGFSSRADTPAVWSEDGSKAGSPQKNDAESELGEDMEKEKQKFLDELDEGLSSEDESESDWDGDSDDGFQKAAAKPRVMNKKKGKAAKARAALRTPIVIPGALKGEMSAYEQIRADNIAEREAMLASLMADFKDYKQDVGLGPKPAQKRKRKTEDGGAFKTGAQMPTERRQSTRLSMKPEDKVKLGSDVWSTAPDGRCRLAEEYSDYDDEDYEIYEAAKKKRNLSRCIKDPNDGVLMPEDITETMLKKVCDRFGEKSYCQKIGTSCHQCRQKTTDMKTVCRSGDCVGVRGQFCGRCLTLRYGEDAREALMNPNWACPPCRNFCNCSICRNRNGKGATGILIQLAQSKGYGNVADYLKGLQNK